MEKTPGTALSRMDAAEVRVQNFMVVCGGLSIFCFVRPEDNGDVCCLKMRTAFNKQEPMICI